MIGTLFGRYDIIEELGHGGMSVVYRGVDTGLEREVAIKVLHEHLAKKAENRQRLHREAKAIARLKHPNIVEVYDYADQDAERAYIVMEYVAGENLRQFLERTGPAPAEYCALMALHLCRALQNAHAHGIVHRDLKPENVMVSRDGRVKLMDFGIAHIFDAETMTQTGSLLGSPAHMAPEMIEGERVDERADVFALGTVIYWVATGQLPFEGKSAPQILKRVLEGIFKNPEAIEPRVGQCFGDIIRKCLAYEPEERYQSITEVLTALEAFIERAGFQDPDAALNAYLRAPKETREQFEREVVPRLLAHARQALSQEQPTEAFRVFNRILAYEPDNAMVRASLARLQRRAASPRIAAAIAAVMLGGLGLYAIYTFLPESPLVEEPTPQPLTAIEASARSPELTVEEEARAVASARALDLAQDVTLEARALATARFEARGLAEERALLLSRELQRSARALNETIEQERQRRNAPGEPDRRKDMGDRVASADMGGLPTADMGDRVLPQERRHTYKFRLLPVSAVLSIDGQDFEAARVNQGVELEQGKTYQLRARCTRGCEPYAETLIVSGPQTPSPRNITLAWRNGIVKIRSQRDSLIYLPGKDRRVVQLKGGKEYLYPVVFGDAASSKLPKQRLTFTIHDRNQMQRSFEQTVVIEPGLTQVIDAQF